MTAERVALSIGVGVVVLLLLRLFVMPRGL